MVLKKSKFGHNSGNTIRKPSRGAQVIKQSGFVRKSTNVVVNEKIKPSVDSVENVLQNKGLRADDEVMYSLNKRQRWKLLEHFSDAESQSLGDERFEDASVQFVLKSHLGFSPHLCQDIVSYPADEHVSHASQSWRRNIFKNGTADVTYELFVPHTTGSWMPNQLNSYDEDTSILPRGKHGKGGDWRVKPCQHDAEFHNANENELDNCCLRCNGDGTCQMYHCKPRRLSSVTLADCVSSKPVEKRGKKKRKRISADALNIAAADERFARKGVLPALEVPEDSFQSIEAFEDSSFSGAISHEVSSSGDSQFESIDRDVGKQDLILCQLSLEESSCLPSNLEKVFGNSYIEGAGTPRSFALCFTVTVDTTDYPLFLLFIGTQSTASSAFELQRTGFDACKLRVLTDDALVSTVLDILKLVKALCRYQQVGVTDITTLFPNLLKQKKTGLRNSTQKKVQLIKVSKWKTAVLKQCDAFVSMINTTANETRLNSHHVVSHDGCNDDIICNVDAVICPVCCLEISADSSIGSMDGTCLRSCHHWICNDCWSSYIQFKVQDCQATNVQCPMIDCNEMVDVVTLLTFLPAFQLPRFMTAVVDFGAITSAEYRRCPGKNCDLIYHCKGFSNSHHSNLAVTDLPFVLCPCGKNWCFACGLHSHWPSNCSARLLYDKFKKDNLGTLVDELGCAFTMPVDCKPCPRCKQPIERWHGCNHMVCICNLSFCWRCLRPIGGDADHNNCQEVSTTTYIFSSLDAATGSRELKAFAEATAYRGKRYGLKHFELGRRLTENAGAREESLELLKQGNFLLENLSLCKMSSTSRHASARITQFRSRMEFFLKRLQDVSSETPSNGKQYYVRQIVIYQMHIHDLMSKLARWKVWMSG